MDDHKIIGSSAAATVNTPKEDSVNQARWLLMPLFGLWIIFSLAGAFLG